MKLKEMLKSMSYMCHKENKSDVNTQPEVVERHAVEVPSSSISEEASELLAQLKNFMKQPNISQIPQAEEETILNDDEINEVMSTLLRFQNEYFQDIPLSEELTKKFVWNIPKNVFEAHMTAAEYGNDVLDPLITFYALLTEDPMYTMGVYMKAIKELITKEYGYVESNASDYYELLKDDEE